ncbi:hypothetical protein PybrP1_007916 [[Pythium] brassicae (nom. inval.)]|nr:hypothetical protein PybrP1_007916 [[Pythium] brassicae (nom. inval.)]
MQAIPFPVSPVRASGGGQHDGALEDHDVTQLMNIDDVDADEHDEHALALLARELQRTQTLRSETEAHIQRLVVEQRQLEALARRESAAQAAVGNRLSRIEQLQAQGRERAAQAAAASAERERQREEQAKAEARRREYAVEARGADAHSDDLDAFLALDSAYY